jgi:uncharacterized protein (TIGR02453 family)
VAFQGSPDEAFTFYEGLQADNSKSYWAEHKAVYEQCVRAPLLALSEELEEEFGPVKLFRPYRDVRFSKDKRPYKIQQGAHAESGGYLQVDADGLMVAGGMYGPDPVQIKRYRAAVHDDRAGKELESILHRLVSAGWEIAGDRLKTHPRGFTADHPRIELLRHRSLYTHRGWPSDEPWLRTPEVVPRVREHWRTVRPLLTWSREHLG